MRRHAGTRQRKDGKTVGLTLSAGGKSAEFTYGGWLRLRTAVAGMYPEDFAAHWRELAEMRSDAPDGFWEKYDAVTEEYLNGKSGVPRAAVKFIWQSDCGGRLCMRDCRRLLRDCGEYFASDTAVYGYAGRENPADGRTFLSLLAAGAEKGGMVWD